MAHPWTKVSRDDFGVIVPVVAETYDGFLNDILSFDVTETMVDNDAVRIRDARRHSVNKWFANRLNDHA